MKVKLLKRIRRRGKNEIALYGITEENGCITGMSYGYDDDEYSDLFSYGNTFREVQEKAIKIYISQTIAWYRKRYKKYTRKYKQSCGE